MKHSTDVTLWLARHHGVLTANDAARLGIDRHARSRLVADGLLVPRHRGVWVDATPPGPVWATDAAAALAACGTAGALSHRSAAWLWGWLARPPRPVEVLLAKGGRTRLAGVRVHRSDRSPRVRFVQGLRLTDPVRTLVNIAGTTPELLGTMVDKAVASRLVRTADLDAVTRAAATREGATREGATRAAATREGATRDGSSRERAQGRPPKHPPGTAALRAHLECSGYVGAPAPSVLESMMAALLVRYGLPVPRAEVVAGEHREYRLDFAYPRRKLAVEVDGYVWHASAERMARDLQRRNRLQAEGWLVLVYTWRQVTDDPDAVATEVADAYRRRGEEM